MTRLWAENSKISTIDPLEKISEFQSYKIQSQHIKSIIFLNTTEQLEMQHFFILHYFILHYFLM